MTRQEALDRAADCERATAAATERAVVLKGRIDVALHLLHRAPLGPDDVDEAIAMLEGREEP